MSGTNMKGVAGLLVGLFIAVHSSGIAAQRAVCKNVTVADIVFLVDGSSSISPQSFERVKNFLRDIIMALDVGPNLVRIGLAQYSSDPHQEFLLKDHMDKRSVLVALRVLSQRGGGTQTGKAFNFLLERYFTQEAGSRVHQRVPQVVVVITDGESEDNVGEAAMRLRKHGVLVFGIGVGEDSQRELAKWLPQLFRLSTDSYNTLNRLTEDLLQVVCVSVDDKTQALAEKFADIVFLVDSGMSQGQFSIFRVDLLRLINQLNAGASTYRIGLAQYGEDVKVEFRLNTHQTKQDLQHAVRTFRLRPQRPNQPSNLGDALQHARTQLFNREVGGRADQGTRQFLVVVSGRPSDDLVSRSAYEVESAGITVVGMSAGAPREAIERFASVGHIFDSPKVTLLRSLFVTEEKVEITEDCKGAEVADIVFIVDESGSIRPSNFQLIRSFLHSTVSGLAVSQVKVRVGIVTYNDKPTAHIYLDTFKDKAEVLQYINILPYRGGGTNTGAALNFTLDEIFRKSSSRKSFVPKVAVLITDGESHDDVSDTAASLRRAGVTIYAIGIVDAVKTELEQIASSPPYKHVFIVDSFTKLKPLSQTLNKILCNTIFTDMADEADVKEECVQIDKADIYFLLDDSGSIGNQDFNDMQKFIIEFIKTFRIGPNHVRMGLVKYSDSPTLEFDLTKYSDPNKLENAVNGILHSGGGTETGRALVSMGARFQEARRARNVPEYLIVITDGEATDEVKAPAEKLRAQNVTIYSIGVNITDQNPKALTQLNEISGDSKRTFRVDRFDALHSIKNQIIRDIYSKVACRDLPLDVIFLVDSSGSISPEDYEKMKNFLKSLESKLAIGATDVHMGVMQFSTNQRLEFALSYDKAEILRRIESMRQVGGGTHTGRAITEVSQYFDESSGGRPGILQKLVVITDGPSQDVVTGTASSLRQKGVEIYAMGVGAANNAELVEITGSPEMVFYERDFDGLKDLESKLVLKLCDKDCTKIKRADIIFLVDGSSSIQPEDFINMQTFMKSIVNIAIVGKDMTRFGVITYTNETQSVFTLKDHDNKYRILNAITNLNQPTGETYTSKALAFSLQYFGAEHGGRKAANVPQIIMVITQGGATDSDNLQPSSDALRNNGVIVFSVGVRGADEAQLEVIAGGDSSKVFYVDTFSSF